MLRYALRRVAAGLLVVLCVIVLNFALLELLPGDAASRLASSPPRPGELEMWQEWTCADCPIHERLGSWLWNFARGDLGTSFSRQRPVTACLRDALPPTLALATFAALVNLIVGIALGLVSVLRRNRAGDQLLTAGALALYAMPTFWLGLMAILVFGFWLRWFPISSLESVGNAAMTPLGRVADRLWHLALPALVLGLGSAAAMSRFVRTGLLESLTEEFTRATRARGAGFMRVLFNALRHSAVPLLQILGLTLPVLVSGSLVVEVVFSLPGMGRLAFDAIMAEDYPLLQACSVLATSLVVAGSLFADLGTCLADPRIRLARSSS
ncbi:hypothetical protein ABI59_04640 [Acidobacteria bacterium Mor1]|nr:hypothetical protein ABI59_04640 [Acidobacteria bacterium Mor1]